LSFVGRPDSIAAAVGVWFPEDERDATEVKAHRYVRRSSKELTLLDP
jgi:hypothetical protein